MGSSRTQSTAPHFAGFRRKRLSLSASLFLLLLLFGISCRPALCAGQTDTQVRGKQATVVLRQGLDLAARGQLAEAEVVLEQARTLAPQNTQVLTALAKVKARIGELPAATVLFRQVTQILPHSAEAHLDLAFVLADQSDLNGALQEVTRAVKLAPNLGLAHLNRARILSDLNRGPEAEAEFAIAARLSPSNPDSFLYWALLERKLGNYPKETLLLRRLVKLQPRNDQAYVLLGQSLDYQSKRAEAIACWRKALALNPNSEEAVYNLSRGLRATDPSQAKTLQSQFLALQQNANSLDQVKTLGNQAYAAIKNRNWPVAISTLRHAITLCDHCEASANLHKDLGLALCQSGDLNAGRKELQIALQLNPGDPDIVRALSLAGNR